MMQGPTGEKAEARVQCQLCGVMSQKQVLVRHQLLGVCKRGRDKWEACVNAGPTGRKPKQECSANCVESCHRNRCL
jgi:hypothetical protein